MMLLRSSLQVAQTQWNSRGTNDICQKGAPDICVISATFTILDRAKRNSDTDLQKSSKWAWKLGGDFVVKFFFTWALVSTHIRHKIKESLFFSIFCGGPISGFNICCKALAGWWGTSNYSLALAQKVLQCNFVHMKPWFRYFENRSMPNIGYFEYFRLFPLNNSIWADLGILRFSKYRNQGFIWTKLHCKTFCASAKL